MIEFVPCGAYMRPAFVCDACREQIAGNGNIVYAVKVRDSKTETREQSPLYAAHKGACDKALEAWLMTHYDDQWMPLWEEISSFLQQLTANASRDLSKGDNASERIIIRHPAADPHSRLP